MLPIYCLLFNENEPYDAVLSEGANAAKHLMKVSQDLIGIILVHPAMKTGIVKHISVPENGFGVWDISISLQPGELNKMDMPLTKSPLVWLMGYEAS